MTQLRASVLIPSYNRPEALKRCLAALAVQTHPADEIFVVWQGDDTATREAALLKKATLGEQLHVIHNSIRGVVPAENLALSQASGEIVLLIDDDAVAPADWIERHLAFYDDPIVGAVGGPAVNYRPDGTPFPVHTIEPIGRITWYGKLIGNMYDHPAEWRSRAAIAVDHLVGYNMSLRRSSFDRFEERLRPYWQRFETDACMQVSTRGLDIKFDFGNVVDHFTTNTAYLGGRDGDLTIKIFNASYNEAFVLGRFFPAWKWPAAMAFHLLLGSRNVPGIVGGILAYHRYGNASLEAKILLLTLKARYAGWIDGISQRCANNSRQSRRDVD